MEVEVKDLSQEKLVALVEAMVNLSKLEFDDMLNFLVKQIITVLKIERCSIFRIFPEKETAYLVIGEPKEEHGVGMEFSFEELGALKEAVESRSPVLIAEPWRDKRTQSTKELIYFKGINAILFIPLVAGDEVIGVIVADATNNKKTFVQEGIYSCTILSNLVSLLLERDLLHKQREEKRALEILGRAAAEAAHRMRNPIVPIGGFARRLAKQAEKDGYPFYREYADVIIREVERAESVLNDLLRFVRSKKLKVASTNINKIVREAAEAAESFLINEKKIQINFELDHEIPSLLLDPAEIRDMFLDILRNAIEAIETEGIIWIRTKRETNQMKVFISNSGCIDEEIIDHIFDPFFTTKSGGTGLGLASVVNTLSAYGGELKVENDLSSKQTTFVLKVPYSHLGLG